MNLPPVTNLVQHKVNCLVEDEGEAKKVIRYIALRSDPTTRLNRITLFVLRVWDVVKHIFGCSDAQKARAVLEKCIYRELPKETHVALAEKVHELVDLMLKTYIDLNNSGQEMTQEHIEFLASTGNSILKKLEKDFNEMMKRTADKDKPIVQTPVKPNSVPHFLTPIRIKDVLLSKEELEGVRLFDKLLPLYFTPVKTGESTKEQNEK